MMKGKKSNCPIYHSLEILGDKWTLLILRDILIYAKSHYKDFLNSEEGIATNILADRLKKLVGHGLLIRKDDAENKSQTIYLPTKKAHDLTPIIGEMKNWGLKYGDKTKMLPLPTKKKPVLKI